MGVKININYLHEIWRNRKLSAREWGWEAVTKGLRVTFLYLFRVQQGHCLQRLGREREALAIYNNVLKTRPEDPALLAIINNNLVSINRAANVFDSRKKMKTATASGLEHKLTTRQRSTIALNHCLLAYHTNQVSGLYSYHISEFYVDILLLDTTREMLLKIFCILVGNAIDINRFIDAIGLFLRHQNW